MRDTQILLMKMVNFSTHQPLMGTTKKRKLLAAQMNGFNTILTHFNTHTMGCVDTH